MTQTHPISEQKPAAQPVTPAAKSPGHRLIWLLGGLALVALVALAAGWLLRPPALHGVLLQSPRQAQDFTLTSSTGEALALNDLRGKWVLLYFGYTYCPDVCPMTLNDLVVAAETLGEQRMADAQVILVTLDPARDTAEHLAAYTAAFHPDFLGMTGPVEQIDQLASQFGVFVERHEPDADGRYLVDHTNAVTVIDPEGYVRLVFPNGVSGEEMAADLAYLMRRG
jgi:protein SCO1/2